MIEKLFFSKCFTLSVKPDDCQKYSLQEVFWILMRTVVESKEEVKAMIQSKLPDPPLQLVHSSEVCQYVGIVSKTLYRCERQGLIKAVKRDHTGKYYLHADMVTFKQKYRQ